MLRNNKHYMTILLTTTLGALIIAGGLFFKYQDHKINELEDQLYLKHQNEQKASDYYESTLNIKTIQTKFNTMKEYPVLKDNKIFMNHKYIYTNEGAFGMKHKITLVGDAQVQYDIVIRFDTAVISSNNGKDIRIKIAEPYVDTESIKIADNSLIMRNEDFNFWSGKKDGTQAQKLFMESFIDSGRNNVLKLYDSKEKQKEINQIAKDEIHALIRTLDLVGNTNVIIEIVE